MTNPEKVEARPTMNSRSSMTSGGREPLVAALILILVVLLFGGASRADVIGHAVVRIVAILSLGWSVSRGGWSPRMSARFPAIFLVAWLALMALQLVPLPFSVWASLPQHEQFAEIYRTLGMDGSWHPLTISPNATINALFASVVPLAVLAAVLRLRQRDWNTLIFALLGYVALSAFMGVLQIATHVNLAYLFRITNADAAVGLFANRNHQAMLLAATAPLLGLVANWPNVDAPERRARQFASACGALLIIPLVLITGSRAGLILMVAGAFGGVMIFRSGKSGADEMQLRKESKRGRTGRPWIPLFGIGVLLSIVGATIVLSRAESVQRLLSEDVSQEVRVRLFGTILDIGHDYAPFGAGFGAFDPVFRMNEPFSNLSPLYLNHAHNDLLEIYVEGGVPALLLMLAFLVWIGLRSATAWKPMTGEVTLSLMLARCGSVILLVLLGASLADYPLRTPALAAFGAIAVAMLSNWPFPAKSFDRPRESL